MAKVIRYSKHLIFRLELRKIPYTLPRRIIIESQERYYDELSRHRIAVAKLEAKGKIREFAVTYDEKENQIDIITIHPLRPYQKISRIKSGRWKKL